jgi:hypothetical protein
MVTGSSLVLCSRINLVAPSSIRLRATLLSIVAATALIVYVPTYTSSNFPESQVGYRIYHVASRLEILFAVQEISLASLYTYLFMRFMKDGQSESQLRIR